MRQSQIKGRNLEIAVESIENLISKLGITNFDFVGGEADFWSDVPVFRAL